METVTATIYFAGGCFWGTEHFFSQVSGVVSTQAGYAQSDVVSPTYRQVCSGSTRAAEAVKVVYDPAVVTLDTLLELYFMAIDPVAVDRQGNDVGTQYRTGIYYTDPAQLPAIEVAMRVEAAAHTAPLAVEVEPVRNFYPAEEYHQHYLDKNPDGYCHIPRRLFEVARRANRISAYVRPDDATLRRTLTPMQYAVTQHNATERPFTGRYWQENRPGVYVDVTTGQPLFVSSDKFDSPCGWPAFSRPVDDGAVRFLHDTSHGLDRIEVRSTGGDAHLGHVFNDGPVESGGMRYCINSAALRFIPLDEMDSAGLSDLKPLVR
ncbi:MAG: peptide-methionine (S)-S-oxide reductase MsrA [Bacteroidales bacterium]|nr:peptide-methionine (S)-S-oxide reductase MsrA [Bacteroidales bacterium]